MKGLGAAVPWVALAVSIMSIFYTMRTFTVTHRPYVGIVEHSFEFLGAPPTAMSWRFAVKNVGSTPTWVTVEQDSATFTLADNSTRTLPVFGEPRGGIYLMPGQTADLTGQFSDAGGNAKATDVLNGQTRMELSYRLSYSSPGAFWRRSSYSYAARNQFRINPLPPRFVMVSGSGT